MQIHTCTTCGEEWPTNYCPVCAHTIVAMPRNENPIIDKGGNTQNKRSGSNSTLLHIEKTWQREGNDEYVIRILETPFREVCRALGLEQAKRKEFLEMDNCIFFFDPEKDYVFCSAVIMSNKYGFYGIEIGANWLETAGKLESQGFKQASDLERFTKPGPDFNISVYLYPDDNPDASASKVKDYSVCVRYGKAL